MRQKYFSHKAIPNSTVLLGFGLDYIEEGNYEMTPKQTKQAQQKEQNVSIAMTDLMNSLNKVSLGIKAWRVTSGSGQDVVNWSALSGAIV